MARYAQITFGILGFRGKLEGAVIPKIEYANLCVGHQQVTNVETGEITETGEHEFTPINKPQICKHCGPITRPDILVRAVKQGANYTPVDKDALDDEKVEYTKEYLGSFNFVPHDTADVMAKTAPGESLNYVTPADRTANDAYVSLVKLLKAHPEKTLASLHTPRSATNIFILGLRGDILVVEQRVNADRLKPLPAAVEGEVNPKHYALLEQTLEIMSEPFDPADYEDGYASTVRAMADAAESFRMDGKTEARAAVAHINDDDLAEKFAALQAEIKERRKKEKVA